MSASSRPMSVALKRIPEPRSWHARLRHSPRASPSPASSPSRAGPRRMPMSSLAPSPNAAASGRGECVPYPRYGETVEGVRDAIEAARPDIENGIDREIAAGRHAGGRGAQRRRLRALGPGSQAHRPPRPPDGMPPAAAAGADGGDDLARRAGGHGRPRARPRPAAAAEGEGRHAPRHCAHPGRGRRRARGAHHPRCQRGLERRQHPPEPARRGRVAGRL